MAGWGSRCTGRHGFGVFSRSICIRRTVKVDPGRLGESVFIGGVSVARGDVVVADGDGVVVLPARHMPDIVASARQRRHAEETTAAFGRGSRPFTSTASPDREATRLGRSVWPWL